MQTNVSMEKKSCKGSLVGPSSPSNLKIIFVLLTKVIVAHMWLIIIYFRYFSLKGLLALCRRLSRSLVWLQVGLHKLFKQFIGKNRSGSRSGNQSENQSKAQGKVIRQSKRGTIWIRTSNWVWVLGKLIFYKVNRREVLTRETTRTETPKSHLGRQLNWIG